MILGVFLILIAIAGLHTYANWRRGLYWIVVLGLLQDPVRKISSGTPAWLVLSTLPVWVVVAFRVWSSRSHPTLASLHPRLNKSVQLFVISLIPAAVVSLTLGPGGWQLTVLGAMTYFTLLYSVVIGYRFAGDARELRSLLGFYCAAAAILLSGSLLEYLQVPFPALGTEMLGHVWTRNIPGVTIYMISGFFRSPDVMGWHAVTTCILAVTLAVSGRWPSRALWIALSVWGGGIALLCGRRKMVYMLPLFALLLVWVLWWMGRRRSMALLTVFIVLISGGLVTFYGRIAPDDTFMTYYTHESGVVYSSVEKHGVSAVIETVRQNGFFGGGLGSGAQGAHRLNVTRSGNWQESGPSKAMVDLGVLGFLCLVAVGVLLLRSLWRTMRRLRLAKEDQFVFWAGLFAMILANGGAFLVSGQIFGDPFISFLLAMSIGMILGASRIELEAAARHAGLRRRAHRDDRDAPVSLLKRPASTVQ